MSSRIECRLVPVTAKYDATSDRWAEQVNEFARELMTTGDSVRLRAEPVSGQKGALTTILVEVVGGSLSTLVSQTIGDWLHRDRTRGVRFELDVGKGEPITVELSGDTSAAERERLVQALVAGSRPTG